MVSHLVGLFVIKNYLPEEKSLPLKIEKPQFEEKTAYIPIIITIIITTIFSLILFCLFSINDLSFEYLSINSLYFTLSLYFLLIKL